MSLESSIPIILEVGVLLVSITWIVGQIRSTTRELTQAVRSLKEAIFDLKTTVIKIDDRVSDHGERITRLEARLP